MRIILRVFSGFAALISGFLFMEVAKGNIASFPFVGGILMLSIGVHELMKAMNHTVPVTKKKHKGEKR